MANNTGPPPSSITLGRSDDAGSRSSPTVNAHNLTRFLLENKYNDGTLYGRVSDQTTFKPPLNAHVLTYQARAAAAVAACDAALGTSSSETVPIE